MASRLDHEFVIFCVAGMVMFAMDMVTLAWVGMWRGLNSRRPNRAAVAAMGQILLLPWVVWGVTMILLSVASWNTAGTGYSMQHFEVYLWGGIAIVINLFFGLPARRRLNHEFRILATTRFESKRRQ
jgi:hypothetical protein